MTGATPTEFVAEHTRWHEQVEAKRTAPFGPLSVTSIHWLTATPQRSVGIPGTWSADADGAVALQIGPDEELLRDGEPLSGTVHIGPLTGIQAVTLDAPPRRIEVAARGGGIALRTRDPESPDRRRYAGTPTFPADRSWAIEGRFVEWERLAVQVDSIVPDRPQHYDSPGVADFEVDGRPLRLTLFPGSGASGLRAIFGDETGRDDTFPASRTVEVVRTGPGTVLIDFNRATNPPCAYSAGATCPLPPPGNRLPIRIQAGERRPHPLR